MNNVIRGAVPADVALPLPGIMRDIEDVAPDCYLRYNSGLRCWELWKDLTIVATEHDKEVKRIRPLQRAVFEELDQRAIDNLRYRRWVGQRYLENPEAYLRWLRQEELEAKAKEKEIARDMMAEGFMKLYKSQRSHTVDLGGAPCPQNTGS